MSEKRRTATETLMAAMEDFGTEEPKECLIIYTNEAGDMCWSATSDSFTVKLGLLEFCKQCILQQI